MPNHIKNRLELIGSEEMVEKVVSKFSTYYERKKSKAFDGRLIFTNKQTNSVGWFDEVNGEFEERNCQPVKNIPKGFEQDYNEAWTRFPSFDKIIPMPDILKDYEPHGRIVTAVKKKYKAPVSGNRLTALLEFQNRENQTLDFEGQDKVLFDRGCKAYEETGFVYWYDWNICNWKTKWNAYSCDKLNDFTFSFETAWCGVPSLIKKMSEKFPEVEFRYEWSDEDTGANCGYAIIKNGIGDVVRLENESIEAYELAFKLRPDYKEFYVLVNGKYEYKDDE